MAPPCRSALTSIPELRCFYPVPLDAGALSRSASQCLMVCFTGDEYCEGGSAAAYARQLRIEVDPLPTNAGHINVEAGFGPWPQVEKWCYEPRTRLSEHDLDPH